MNHRLLTRGMYRILKLLNQSVHVLKHGEVLELLQDLYGIVHGQQVAAVYLNLMNTVIRVAVAVIFPVEHFNWCFVTKPGTPHILKVQLNGSSAYKRFLSLIFKKG